MATTILTHTQYAAKLAANKPVAFGSILIDADSGAFIGIVGTNGVAGVRTLTVTSAQLLALRATPIQILAAIGTGISIVPTRWAVNKPAGTAYTVGAGDDLQLKYTNGAGTICSGIISATGFLDQATAQTRAGGVPGSTGTTASDVNPTANAAVVIHNIGASELTTGTSTLVVRVWFDMLVNAFVS